MDGIPYWHDDPDLWDSCELDDIACPGVTRVHVTRARKWDRKEVSGAHGETQSFKGTKAADVTIKVRYTKATEWTAIQALLAHIEPEPTKQEPKPLTIKSPRTAVRGIYTIQVDTIEGPDAVERDIEELTINCFEFWPKPAAKHGSGTPKGPIDYCASLRTREASTKALMAQLASSVPTSPDDYLVQQSELAGALGTLSAIQTEMLLTGCGAEKAPSGTQAAP